MKKRFTEEQIIRVLKEAEAGAKTTELCRAHASGGRSGCRLHNRPNMTIFNQRLYFLLVTFFKAGQHKFSGCAVLDILRRARNR